MGAVSSIASAVSDVVSPISDVVTNTAKAVESNPIPALLSIATGNPTPILAQATGVPSPIISAITGDPSSLLSGSDATDIGSSFDLTPAPAADIGSSFDLTPAVTDSQMGSLANIPGNIGGALPTGGGLDTGAAATGTNSLPTFVNPNAIGTTSNFATGLQTTAVQDPVTGVVTNVPTGQSLSGTTGTAIPGNATTSALPKVATPAATTPTTSGLPGSTTTNNFTDILGSLAQSGITGDKTGRTLLQPSMFQTSAPQSNQQILGALKQLGSLSDYHPELINAVRQRMAHGGQPHHVQHPEAEPGEPIFRTGGHSHHVQGKGDGQSDDIPAMLADGEWVADADFVSQLGNGSNKAGAELLDNFREVVRKHKRSAPTDKIPPKSKKLTSYLKEAARMTK
jgi:hypothetical protein